jgi:hypothetical protein
MAEEDIIEDENDSDFTIVLSSDLIAVVMEQYFNAEMFKMPVKVVNFVPTETGAAFALDFIPQDRVQYDIYDGMGGSDIVINRKTGEKINVATREMSPQEALDVLPYLAYPLNKTKKHSKRGKKGKFISDKEFEEHLHVQNYDEGDL